MSDLISQAMSVTVQDLLARVMKDQAEAQASLHMSDQAEAPVSLLTKALDRQAEALNLHTIALDLAVEAVWEALDQAAQAEAA